MQMWSAIKVSRHIAVSQHLCCAWRAKPICIVASAHYVDICLQSHHHVDMCLH